MAAVAAQIGAVAISRAVAQTEAVLAGAVLQAARETLGAACTVETARIDPNRRSSA